MLKTEEVIILEERWKEFKNKRLFKKAVTLFLVLLLLLSLILLYLIFAKLDKVSPLKNVIIVSNNITTNSSQTANVTDSAAVEDVNKTSNIKVSPVEVSQKNISVAKESETINNSVKNDNMPSENVDTPKVIDNSNKTRVVEVPKVQDKKPIEVVKPPEDSKILIETSDIQDIDALINKFESTNNIIFAIMIAEEFFDKRDYNKSLEWILRANEMDPSNETTWILFAKNQIKLGNKDDATRALEGFMSYSKNATGAANLLQKIRTGEYR